MSPSPVARNATSRRKFLQRAGLTAVASAVSANMSAWAQGRSASPAPPDTSKAASAPHEISEEARQLANLVERRYGKHLSPTQLEAVTREIDGRLQGGKRLREVHLANHDEPDFVFRA
jgi:hypothetical protein